MKMLARLALSLMLVVGTVQLDFGYPVIASTYVGSAAAIAFMAQQGVPVGASPVQQTASHADACTPFTGEAIATATTTITLTPGSTGYIYISEVVVTNGAGASAVTAAATSTITTTNLNSLQWVLFSGTTAGSSTQLFNENYGPGGMRSQTPGTNVTFVLPAVKVNQGIHMHGCYTAP